MLVIGRKRDEKFIIDGRIEITILKVGRNYVKFGIDAPRDVPIRPRPERAIPPRAPCQEPPAADGCFASARADEY